MGDMLSQAEIDALLGGTTSEEEWDLEESKAMEFEDSIGNTSASESLSDIEKDAIGEIGNISMGTAATTLSTLLGQKVLITTPSVKITTWKELSNQYVIPYIAVKVEYREGLEGTNLLVLDEQDVKIITDLMMGGDGHNVNDELTEIHLSAISEAMNQMVGSSATSMSSMFMKKIDISPPDAQFFDFKQSDLLEELGVKNEEVVIISFRMEVGDIIDSEIMQLIPVRFAKDLADKLLHPAESKVEKQKEAAPLQSNVSASQEQPMMQQPMMQQPMMQQPMMQQPMMQQPMMQQPMMQQPMMQQPMQDPMMQHTIHAQPVQFQSFDASSMIIAQTPNMGLIMDVPLQITVELGRTQKAIKEILDFAPGTIIELDKQAGEPIDILVNGKFIAKGEVVVIDENFGIRITDIISPEKRI